MLNFKTRSRGSQSRHTDDNHDPHRRYRRGQGRVVLGSIEDDPSVARSRRLRGASEVGVGQAPVVRAVGAVGELPGVRARRRQDSIGDVPEHGGIVDAVIVAVQSVDEAPGGASEGPRSRL
jgi:hypothetical protein